jgi:hypothetical protein
MWEAELGKREIHRRKDAEMQSMTGDPRGSGAESVLCCRVDWRAISNRLSEAKEGECEMTTKR